MTGRVICDPADPFLDICTDGFTQTSLTTKSFSAEATFDDFDVTRAENLTILDTVTGQAVCDSEYDEYAPGTTIFSKYWPTAFVAHSTYKGTFTNIIGIPSTYELIEKCTYQPGSAEYSCEPLWDSVYGSNDVLGIEDEPMPKLPCCGEINKLTVQIAGGVGGTVTSDDGKIDNCTNTCEANYDGTLPPDYDGCPEVVLTATGAGPGFYLTGWSGDGVDCLGTGDCIVTPEAKVTATFEDTWFTLTVKDRVWIFDPRSDFDDPDQFYCYGPEPCTKRFAPGTTVIVKRKNGKFNGWSGGDCDGVPNSVTTCENVMDKNITITADFSN